MRKEGRHTKHLEDNTIIVDLSTEVTNKGRLNLPKEAIKANGIILANKFLDYVRSGGDMDNLTPNNVFGRSK